MGLGRTAAVGLDENASLAALHLAKQAVQPCNGVQFSSQAGMQAAQARKGAKPFPMQLRNAPSAAAEGGKVLQQRTQVLASFAKQTKLKQFQANAAAVGISFARAAGTSHASGDDTAGSGDVHSIDFGKLRALGQSFSRLDSDQKFAALKHMAGSIASLPQGAANIIHGYVTGALG